MMSFTPRQRIDMLVIRMLQPLQLTSRPKSLGVRLSGAVSSQVCLAGPAVGGMNGMLTGGKLGFGLLWCCACNASSAPGSNEPSHRATETWHLRHA
jgi:hypothetical protein